MNNTAEVAKAVRDMAEATCRQALPDESGWNEFEKAVAVVLQRWLDASKQP